MPEMNTERLTHLKTRENVEMRTINRKLMELAGVGDRTMEQTVQERDLEARRSWLTTKDAVLGFFGLADKKTREAGGVVSDRISQVADEVNDQMKDWWREQQAAKTRQEQSREARWVKRMQQYEELKLKEAEGRDLEMGETVQVREIETELSVREAQQFLKESLAKAQDQLSQLSESIDNQRVKAYKYVAVLTVAASLAAACSGPDQKTTVTPTSGDLGPTATLVIPPTETPTQLPPTETPTLTPTETPTETQTPEPTATPETVYRFDGIEMTETELNEWADKIKFCNDCLTEEEIKAVIFTNHIVSREITNSSGIVTKIDYSILISKVTDQNRRVHPIIFLYEAQKESSDNPGYNIDWMWTINILGGFPVDLTQAMNNPDKSIHDPNDLSQPSAGKILRVNLKGGPNYSNYKQLLKQIIETGIIDNNKPSMMPFGPFRLIDSDGETSW